MTPSKYQRAIYKVFQNTKKDLTINAVAGSGKTTTLLQLLQFIPSGKTILFLAFNKSIIAELQKRNTNPTAAIMTIHSCGWQMILRTYGSRVRLNVNKGIAKTEQAMKALGIADERRGYYFYLVPKVLDLMRCNLCENNPESILEMLDHYAIDVDAGEESTDLPVIMTAFKYLVKDKRQFDFMDMIYVPVTDPRLRFTKYDFVFCDESQDFSTAQREFILNCLNRSGRLVAVGDERQAIYGFAGADAESYARLGNLRGNSVRMPLSVSYRCASQIVEEAQKIVPYISAAPDAPEGVVREGNMTEVGDGDWILCRNLRPLVQAYFWLVKRKIKAVIRGRDIAEGLIALINKTRAKSLETLFERLEEEREKLHDKLRRKGVRRPALHPKSEALLEKITVIRVLAPEIDAEDGNVTDLVKLIDGIFSDDLTTGVLLSTIHKAKGLENDRVFFLLPELIPSKWAEKDWQIEQEMNLKYVAVTRAKSELIYIRQGVFVKEMAR